MIKRTKQQKHWEKVFRLGNKINKELKLTEAEVVNLSIGTTTSSNTKWIGVGL